jgi:hypothetical protein
MPELRDEIFDTIEREMQNRGWTPSEQQPFTVTPVQGRFWRSLEMATFVATVQFTCIRSQSAGGGRQRGGRQGLLVDVDVGVTCPSAERLLRLVDASHRNAGLEINVSELATPIRETAVHVKSAEQVDEAVGSIVAMADEYAEVFAKERADVGAFIAHLQSDPEAYDFEAEIVPAILAVLGSGDEARESLARYEQEVASGQYRVFSRRLKQWLDSDGGLPQPESTCGEKTSSSLRQGKWPTLGEVHERSRKRREAVEAVRRACHTEHDLTRDQKRAMLQRELDRNGLRESTVWIEATLNELEGLQRSAGLASVGAALHVGRIVASMIGFMRDKTRHDPKWLEPPARAFYEIRESSNGWATVSLDTPYGWLDRVYGAASHKIGGIAMVKIWLASDEDTTTSSSHIVVYIGGHRVGLLDPQAIQAFSAAMTEARLHDALPWGIGRLTHLKAGPRYILEVPMPLVDARCGAA